MAETVEFDDPKLVVFSVDVETSGTSPATGSLLTVGAVSYWPGNYVPQEDFYVRMFPQSPLFERATMEWWEQHPEAKEEAFHSEPRFHSFDAMQQLTDWVQSVVRRIPGAKPLFLAWPSTFDFGWIDFYYKMNGMENVFGYKTLDQPSFAAGVFGRPELVLGSRSQGTYTLPTNWEGGDNDFPHHALYDARSQLVGFKRMLSTIEAARMDKSGVQG